MPHAAARRHCLTEKTRRILGWTLVAVGIPLFILPIPLGLPLLIPGFGLLVTSSPATRRAVIRLGRKFPGIYRKIRGRAGLRRAGGVAPCTPTRRE